MNATGAAAVKEPPRRDFLKMVSAGMAAVGTGAVAWTFIDSMNPDKATLAAGAPIDIDLKPIAEGQQIVVLWRGKPMLIVKRTKAAVASLQDPKIVKLLSDPNSKVLQQPPYAENWHRSAKPDLLVLVGVCTHLGCLPGYFPKPSATTPVPDWPSGYFCPCHGSKYDLAGRVWKGVPAPYNLPVPPYRYVSDTMIRIGENPAGQTFSMSSIVQM
ncbi:MAG: ubiquinol-cytochrome c reductase iron-sulfur subunit [Rhodospirillales bacterium]|nr:ubiquinol-cytochrome c reductase iron-sulfur subunit [Rhodospirillales bacterium]